MIQRYVPITKETLNCYYNQINMLHAVQLGIFIKGLTEYDACNKIKVTEKYNRWIIFQEGTSIAIDTVVFTSSVNLITTKLFNLDQFTFYQRIYS